MQINTQPPPIRDDGLQLTEDRSFQNRFWTLQRISWVGYAFLLLAALAGFLGSGGYFSNQTLEMGDSTVVLPRVSRWQTIDNLRFTVRDGSTVEIVLGAAFRDHFMIEQVQPKPSHSEATASGLRLRFSLAGDGDRYIDFDVMALRPGWASYDVSVGPVTEQVRTVVLP